MGLILSGAKGHISILTVSFPKEIKLSVSSEPLM